MTFSCTAVAPLGSFTKATRRRRLTAAQIARDLDKMLTRAERAIRARFIELMRRYSGQLSLKDVADMIASGQAEQALAAFERVARELAQTTTSMSIQAAQVAATHATAEIGVTVAFNQVNQRAVARMAANELKLVSQLVSEQRGAIRAALTQGIREGINPVDQARRFRQAIGLTERQMQAVNRYRESLQSGTRAALTRQLRDRRFDRTVANAARNRTPLSNEQIDTMVERYRERYLKYRSEVIARTEALRAVHEGNYMAYQQAIDDGDVLETDLVRTWRSASDARVRHSHKFMNGQMRRFGEAFKSGDGNSIMYPGDLNAPASDTVQCRCVVITRMTEPGQTAEEYIAANGGR